MRRVRPSHHVLANEIVSARSPYSSHSHTVRFRKSLKVAELKEILSKSDVTFPSKATKSDLIAKITSTPAALQFYNKLYNTTAAAAVPSAPQNDDLVGTLTKIP